MGSFEFTLALLDLFGELGDLLDPALDALVLGPGGHDDPAGLPKGEVHHRIRGDGCPIDDRVHGPLEAHGSRVDLAEHPGALLGVEIVLLIGLVRHLVARKEFLEELG